MKIITIKMSEEGRDEIISARVEVADEGYAEAYFQSVKGGFIKFPAFTVLDVTMADEPTLEEKLVQMERDLTNAMIDKLDEVESEMLKEHGEVRWDDYTEDEDGNVVGIIYPENGAPELDHARGLVNEALDALRGNS